MDSFWHSLHKAGCYSAVDLGFIQCLQLEDCISVVITEAQASL